MSFKKKLFFNIKKFLGKFFFFDVITYWNIKKFAVSNKRIEYLLMLFLVSFCNDNFLGIPQNGHE